MTNKHRRTLAAIFERPTRADVSWRDVESLLRGLGAIVKQGEGSRVRIALRVASSAPERPEFVRIVLHEPHPRQVLSKGAVEDLRLFLGRAGVEPP